MKMLKKLAALVLAGTMVLLLFTACGGDSAPSPEAQAEAQMMTTINASRPEGQKLQNSSARRAVANQNIDATIQTGFGPYSSDIKFYTDTTNIKDGEWGFTLVAKYDYQNTKLDDLMKKITGGGMDVEHNAVVDWSQVGVVVKTVSGQTYIAVSVAVDFSPRG